jgi:hypothetical protein
MRNWGQIAGPVAELPRLVELSPTVARTATRTQAPRFTQSFQWTEDDEESLRVLKLGGAVGIFMLLAFVMYDLHVRGPNSPGAGFYWLALGGICLFFGLAWTQSFKRHWKFWTLCFCTFLMWMFVIISSYTRDPESRFITMALCPIATAAFVSWGTRWQSGMALASLLSFSAAQYLVPIQTNFNFYRGMGLAASVLFSQYTAFFIERYRRRLRKQVQDLEAAGSFRQNQIATMAHDIRSPVAALSGYVSLLEEDGIGGKEREDLLGRIGSTAWNMDLLVSNVLDLYRCRSMKSCPRRSHSMQTCY